MRHLDAIHDPRNDSKAESYLLRELGQKAAKVHLNSGTPMVEAVATVVKEASSHLNHHHVQRIVEYANHHAFRELRSRTLGDSGDPVSFDGGPASTMDVLKRVHGDLQLRKEAGMSPGSSRISLLEQVQHMIKSAEPRMEKAASAPPIGVDAYELLTKLGQAAQKLETEALLLTSKKASALRDICAHSDYLLRHGESHWVIRKIAESAAGPHHSQLLKEAMDVVRAQVFPRLGIEESQEPSFEEAKVASLQPNPNHPLHQAFRVFMKVGEDLQVALLARESLVKNRKELFGAMRRAS